MMSIAHSLLRIPILVLMACSSWYAPRVGWVKSHDSSDMGVIGVVLLS